MQHHNALHPVLVQTQQQANLLQDFKACLQSHELALCRKDVNAILGEVEDGPIEYQALAESIYQVLATRLEVSPV